MRITASPMLKTLLKEIHRMYAPWLYQKLSTGHSLLNVSYYKLTHDKNTKINKKKDM